MSEKVSALTETEPEDGDEIMLARSGQTYKTTIADLLALALRYGSLNNGTWISIQTDPNQPAPSGYDVDLSFGFVRLRVSDHITTDGGSFGLTTDGGDHSVNTGGGGYEVVSEGGGINFREGQVTIESDNGNQASLRVRSEDGYTFEYDPNGGDGTMDLRTGVGFDFRDTDAASVLKLLGTSGGRVGFFGVPPAAQPATPVTLGDVIAALQTLGLVQ